MVIFISHHSQEPTCIAYERPDPFKVIREASELEQQFLASSRGVRVLCIDGGGVRGILAIRFLKRLQEALIAVGSKLKVWQLFDMVGGTSTGGIIAAALVVNHMEIDELERLYLGLGPAVFSRTMWERLTRAARPGGPAYDGDKLHSFLNQTFGNSTFEDIPFPKIFVTATPVFENPPTTILFSNFHKIGTHRHFSEPFTTVDAALATASAPTFFPCHTIRGESFMDGGWLCNNPTEIAVEEATNLWPDRPIDLVLSLGTGIMPEVQIHAPETLGFLASALTSLVGQTIEVDLRMEKSHYSVYRRFNPPNQLSLDDYSNMRALSALTDQFLRWQTHVRDMRAVVEIITGAPPHPEPPPPAHDSPSATWCDQATQLELHFLRSKNVELQQLLDTIQENVKKANPSEKSSYLLMRDLLIDSSVGLGPDKFLLPNPKKPK